MKIKTLVIDDDPNWQKIISKMVQVNPLLELAGVCGSAMEAYGHLVEADIDLLICDIELPDMTGVNFVKSLRQSPPVFFRVHRSYLVNRTAIASVNKDDLVLLNGEVISIGEQYKASFHRKHVAGNLISRNS